MKNIYFTITGTKYRFGHEFMKPGMKVKLIKECGYVANSTYTVKGESWSAGRLYDHIGKKAKGTVKLVLPDAVICKLDKKS